MTVLLIGLTFGVTCLFIGAGLFAFAVGRSVGQQEVIDIVTSSLNQDVPTHEEIQRVIAAAGLQ